MFRRIVASRIIVTSSFSTPIASKNFASSAGPNVAVKYTTYIPFPAILYNYRTSG